MKKFIILLIIIFIPFITVNAKEETTTVSKDIVTLENCNDISQIWLNKNNKVIRVGLLAYDSADTTYNKEIQTTICNKLKEAKKIELEYDLNTNKDKYNRELAWIYIDGKLLQDELISEGLGMVNHVEDDYSYIDDLCISEAKAIKDKKGIWSLGVEEKYCDSGIILEKIEKENNKEINTKSLDSTSKIIITVVVLSILLFCIILITGEHYEKK